MKLKGVMHSHIDGGMVIQGNAKKTGQNLAKHLWQKEMADSSSVPLRSMQWRQEWVHGCRAERSARVVRYLGGFRNAGLCQCLIHGIAST